MTASSYMQCCDVATMQTNANSIQTTKETSIHYLRSLLCQLALACIPYQCVAKSNVSRSQCHTAHSGQNAAARQQKAAQRLFVQAVHDGRQFKVQFMIVQTYHLIWILT